MNEPMELEKYRAAMARAGYTTVVDYQTNELSVIDPATHEVKVYPLTLACATYYLL